MGKQRSVNPGALWIEGRYRVTAVIRLQADRLKKFRALYGLEENTALAARMAVSRATVINVLHGLRSVTVIFVVSLIAAFDNKLEFGDLFEIDPLGEETSVLATSEN